MRRFLIVTLGVVGLVAAVVALWLVARQSKQSTHHGQTTAATPLVNQATLAALPHKRAASADLSHLAPGLVTPTNSWLSGMVLQATPEAVYPLPLSFKPSNSGFELGLPTVRATATEIDGQHLPGLQISLPAATGFQLTRYDKLSATLTYRQHGTTLGNVTVTEGSPYVFYHAMRTSTLSLPLNPADVLQHDDHYARFRSNGQVYALTSAHGLLRLTTNRLELQVPAGSDASYYALPGDSDELRAYAGNVVQGVSVDYAQHGQAMQTSLHYHTANGQPTVQASLPYRPVAGRTVATYPSAYGSLLAHVGTNFTATVPVVAPKFALNLIQLSEAQRQQLTSLLAADTASTRISQQDSYFAGKQLARAANLLSLAEQLHQTSQASTLKTQLSQAFAARLGPHYWYYDSSLHGVAAQTTGFGSQDFNDHHFHYGYWLYAAAILAHYDSSFKDKYADQLNLLAADIASYQPSQDFPITRTYDPYAGHSWAAGLAPFADGNNQESSSEAVHAWNGVALWGAATNNQRLQQTGQWLLSNEANAAASAWRAIDVDDATLKNYTSPVVGINFGGKRVYSTFFSDQPGAKLGIQLIPLDPSMQSFAIDGKQIASTVAASIAGDNFNVPLGDYDLMYLALYDPQRALSLAGKQTIIDDGNSKTYLYAWLFARLDHAT